MNIILISDDRLKVILTDADLNNYGIRVEDMDYDNIETKRVFRTILDKAKNETGFDASHSRIFIQIYPDIRGGCEMYVSRIGEKSSSCRSGRGRVSYGEGGKEKSSEHIYRFEAMEDLLRACRLLREVGFSVTSSAYAERENGDGACYLMAVLTVESEARASYLLSEYGERCADRYGRWWIAERCALLCEGNAVGILGNL